MSGALPRGQQHRYSDAAYQIPDGESAADFTARAWSALQRLRSRHTDEHFAVVTHGGFMTMVARRAAGLSPVDNFGFHQQIAVVMRSAQLASSMYLRPRFRVRAWRSYRRCR